MTRDKVPSFTFKTVDFKLVCFFLLGPIKMYFQVQAGVYIKTYKLKQVNEWVLVVTNFTI